MKFSRTVIDPPRTRVVSLGVGSVSSPTVIGTPAGTEATVSVVGWASSSRDVSRTVPWLSVAERRMTSRDGYG